MSFAFQHAPLFSRLLWVLSVYVLGSCTVASGYRSRPSPQNECILLLLWGPRTGQHQSPTEKNPRVEHEDHLTKRLFWGKTSIFPSIVWLENIKCMLALVPLCTVMCKIIRVTLNFCIFEQLCTLYFNKFVSIHFSQYLKLSLFLKKLLLKISSKFHRVFSNLKKNPPATITDAKHFLGGRSKGPINQV